MMNHFVYLDYLQPCAIPSEPRNTPLMLGLVFTNNEAFHVIFPNMKYCGRRCSLPHSRPLGLVLVQLERRLDQDQVTHLRGDGEHENGVQNYGQVASRLLHAIPQPTIEA